MKNARKIVDEVWGVDCKCFSPLTDDEAPTDPEFTVILPKCYDSAIVGAVQVPYWDYDYSYPVFRIAYSREDLIRIVMMNYNATKQVAIEYVRETHENIYDAMITLFPEVSQWKTASLQVPIVMETLNTGIEL